MKILELFCGTKSFSKVAEALGHEVFTVDIEKDFNPSLCIDIMDLKPEMIPFKPDVIWASPPCEKFSIMQISRNWNKSADKVPIYTPKNEETKKAINIVKTTLKLIEELKPKYWIIENPRAMLRKQDFMPNNFRKTVTYCKYGHLSQKATDIWTNINWIPRPICKANSPCHVRSPRGSRNGIQGTIGFRNNRNQKHPIDISRTKWNDKVLRAIIPEELCLEILEEIEE